MTDQTTPEAPQAVPQPAPPPTQTINIQAPAAGPPSNGAAIASMVLGIVGLLIFWIPLLGWICPIIGFVLGLVSLQRTYGKGFAIAGIATSGVALLIKVIFWVILIGAFGAAAASHTAAY